MEETRENRLAQLRAKNIELEQLEERNAALEREVKTLENEDLVK